LNDLSAKIAVNPSFWAPDHSRADPMDGILISFLCQAKTLLLGPIHVQTRSYIASKWVESGNLTPTKVTAGLDIV
jgi:hypothetical protein